MILCDTDVLVDILRRHPPAVQWVQSVANDELIIPGYVALELVQGCRSKRDIDAVTKILKPFKLVWPAAMYCERAYQILLTHWITNGLGMIDSLIAQTAIGLDVPLHTFNRKHFESVPGLRTTQPYVR
jgi:predicted nucleic acid-binding protein